MTDEERFWNRRRLAQTLTAIAALWAVAALLTLFGGWRSSAAARAAGALGAKLSGAGRGGNMIALVTAETEAAVSAALLAAGAARVMTSDVGG